MARTVQMQIYQLACRRSGEFQKLLQGDPSAFLQEKSRNMTGLRDFFQVLLMKSELCVT